MRNYTTFLTVFTIFKINIYDTDEQEVALL